MIFVLIATANAHLQLQTPQNWDMLAARVTPMGMP